MRIELKFGTSIAVVDFSSFPEYELVTYKNDNHKFYTHKNPHTPWTQIMLTMKPK